MIFLEICLKNLVYLHPTHVYSFIHICLVFVYSVQQAHSVFAGLSAVWADLWLYIILAESLVKRRCGMSADLLPDSLDMHMDSNHWNLQHSWLLSFPWAVYNREILVRMLTVRRPSTRHADTVMQGTEEANRIQWNLLIFEKMIQINLLIHSSSFLFAHMFLQVYPGDAAPASGCSLCASRNLADLNVWNIFKKGRWSLVSDGRRLPGVCSTGEQEEPTTPATSRRWSRRNFIPKGREITGSHWGVACPKRPFFLWDYTLDSYANGYPQRYNWLFPQSGSWKMNERNDVKVL